MTKVQVDLPAKRPLKWASEYQDEHDVETVEPVHIVAVYDNESNHEALYVGGDLFDSCYTIYTCDVARAVNERMCHFSWVAVNKPDGMHWPEHFDKLMPYIDDEASDTSSERSNGNNVDNPNQNV